MPDHDRTTSSRYDTIGTTYAEHRRPDPRIAARIDAALGTAATVVDVGSGTGSYEPRDRRVVAVEPSTTMIRQRPPGSAPVVRAVAEHLPFADERFDVALAVLTVHHWSDAGAGLAELARVAPRQVVLTWDPAAFAEFWLVRDYLPELAVAEAGMATLAAVVDGLDVVDVVAVPVPADCVDGFCGASWKRPHAYLDPSTRHAISGFAACPPAAVRRAVEQLTADLDDGTWARRHGDLDALDELDLGYRLVLARKDPYRPGL